MPKSRTLAITIIREVEVLEFDEGEPLYCDPDCSWYAYDGLFFGCQLFQCSLDTKRRDEKLYALRCEDCQTANARELPSPASDDSESAGL